jgi:hypothetical protein
MQIRKVSETSSKITLSYDRGPAGTEGYLYYKDGVRVSRTFNPNDLQVTFSKPFTSIKIEAVKFTAVDTGTYPSAPSGTPPKNTSLPTVS